MRTFRVLTTTSFVLATLAAGLGPAVGTSSALADDKAPPAQGGDKPPAAKPEPGKIDPKTPEGEPTTRLERAKKLVRDLETTIAVLKAAKSVDPESMKALEMALAEARKLAKPITAAELTEEERKGIAEEIAKAGEGGKDAPPAANPLDDWRQRAMTAAFKDADLSEEQQIAATKIIGDWFGKSEKARLSGDTKSMSDLKRERDDALEKALGRKKAQKVINNLNAMGGGRK